MSKTELVCMAIYTIVLLGLVACKAFTDTYKEANRRQEIEQRLEQFEQDVQALMLEANNDRD